ncbi:hypothetical protein HMPREF1317_0274 [Schaalia georgiae F0490]|uniref:Uncharacterized protein n=1 Tax=Schaalia georgiae F0490 TaxID=1125717 RepID=J0NSM9_9ACTO|nr:hypothetical protein HMPREF1317_0274 [Schaalia georgiae F0490]
MDTADGRKGVWLTVDDERNTAGRPAPVPGSAAAGTGTAGSAHRAAPS